MTKRCPHCAQDKPLEAFALRRGNNRQSWCQLCLKYYQRGRPRVLLAKRLVRERKVNKTCADCGVLFPHYVLDFDHRPGETKTANINVLVKRGASREVMLAELAKCDLVCANCHRVRTYMRKESDAMAEDALL